MRPSCLHRGDGLLAMQLIERFPRMQIYET